MSITPESINQLGSSQLAYDNQAEEPNLSAAEKRDLRDSVYAALLHCRQRQTDSPPPPSQTLQQSGQRPVMNMDRSNETPKPEKSRWSWSNSTSNSLSPELSEDRNVEPTVLVQPAAVHQVYEHNMDDLQFRLSNEFTTLYQEKADTVVYIGPPARSSEQSQNDYEHIKAHFTTLHRLRSTSLRNLSSPAFDKLLRPNASIRAEKRLRKLGVLKNADANPVQYHVDLRPPSEDEEAVILLTDLTCSQGILRWHLAIDKYNLPRRLVLGTDELDGESNPYFQTRIQSTPKTMLQIKQERKAQAKAKVEQMTMTDIGEPDRLTKNEEVAEVKPIPNMIANKVSPEYLALRHHSAVERLLNAMCFNDPILDSAPKMWTYFTVARYFGCAKVHRINNWIVDWIYNKSNVNFIQNNPEVTYRIGMDIESPDMVRVAFSLLVGERAMSNINREINETDGNPATSVHGRMYEYLDDDEWNRVDHAATCLAHRVHHLFDSIVVHMNWLRRSEEFRRIDDIVPRSSTEQEHLTSFKTTIRNYVRGRILAIISQDLQSVFFDHDPNTHLCAAYRRVPIPTLDHVYNELQLPARKFTRTFWLAMQKNTFEVGNTNTSIELMSELKRNSANLGRLLDAFARDPYNGILRIHMAHLRVEAYPVNEIIVSHERQDKPQLSIPGATVPPRYWTHLPGSSKEGSNDTDTSVKYQPSSPLRSSNRLLNGTQLIDKSFEKRRRTLESNQEHDLPFRPAIFGQTSTLGLTQIKPEAPNVMSVGSTRTGDKEHDPIAQGKNFPSPASSGSEVQPDLAHAENRPSLSGVPIEAAAPPEIWPSVSTAQPGLSQKPAIRRDLGIMQNSTPKPESVPRVKFKDVSSFEGTFDPDIPLDVSPDDGVTPDGASPRKRKLGLSSEETDHYGTKEATSATHVLSYQSETAGGLNGTGFIDLDAMLQQFSAVLSRMCEDVIYPPHLFHADIRVPIDLVDFLVCLEDDEWKYLPLWAGGCDDGTGGVFDEVDVPNLEAGGFRGGKRGITISRQSGKDNFMAGDDGTSISGTDSTFDEITSQDALSTVGKASKLATDGTRTVKSLSDTTSESEFMNQDEIYEQIQAMKMEEARKGKKRANDENQIVTISNHQGLVIMHDSEGANLANDIADVTGNESDDVSTIMGAGSDTQGDMFHDIDDDDDHDVEDNDEDEDVEIIDKHDF